MVGAQQPSFEEGRDPVYARLDNMGRVIAGTQRGPFVNEPGFGESDPLHESLLSLVGQPIPDPQCGHTNPSGQRRSTKYSRHAPSVGNHSSPGMNRPACHAQ